MDSAGKKRLLGAVVVFAAAILFLPLLFSGAGVRTLEPPMIPAAPVLPDLNDVAPATANDAKRLETDISASHGEPTFYPIQPPQVTADEPVSEVQEQFRLVTPVKAPEPKPVPTAAPKPVAAPAPAVAPAPKPAAAPAPVVKTEPAPKPAAEPKAESVVTADAKKAEEARKTTAAATTLPSAWVVQIASLSNKANADAAVEKLRAKGYRASLSAGNNVWRVIIGPELDRAVAENTRDKVLADDSLKMDAIIMPYRP
ncbi:MAG: SPOR domain-containing protein [Moraxellaceae bacterium]|nr:SPOR domain-containing protein [Moraxellaceae bacterium]MDZ4387011.1 SPOR domain-containing protein [Moraxellaceae bacterium]